MTGITPLALAAVFASVALLTGAIVSRLLSPDDAARRRLREVTDAPGTKVMVLPDLTPLSGDTSAGGGWDAVAGMLPRSKKELARLRQRMLRAGIESPAAPVIYSLAEIVLPIALGGAVYLAGVPAPPAQLLAVMVAAAAGFFLPGLWLERQLNIRRREIENGLPDALDLLVVCIEAGSGLDQALMKTSEEIAFTYPALGDELRLLTSEIRAGKTRMEAFKSLASRTKVDDVRALVAMLIQTDRFGTSIGQALRTHADTARTKRRQRAEESAQKIGVKLVFPLVLFFFPAFYVVVLGPAIVTFVNNFK
ncbi:MAG: type II secretion system F family protein [Vicinamibacterales bacterium]